MGNLFIEYVNGHNAREEQKEASMQNKTEILHFQDFVSVMK